MLLVTFKGVSGPAVMFLPNPHVHNNSGYLSLNDSRMKLITSLAELGPDRAVPPIILTSIILYERNLIMCMSTLKSIACCSHLVTQHITLRTWWSVWPRETCALCLMFMPCLCNFIIKEDHEICRGRVLFFLWDCTSKDLGCLSRNVSTFRAVRGMRTWILNIEPSHLVLMS